MKKVILTALAAIAIVGCSHSEKSQICSKPFSNEKIQLQVDDLYNKMSMEDRLAQIHGVRPILLMKDGKLDLELCKKRIPNGVGHVSQFACMQDIPADKVRDFVRDIQNYLVNQTPMGIPAIFHEEAITGFTILGATSYPQQVGVACTWNPELAQVKCDQTREAMRSCGGTMALSPMVDVVRTQHFNRVEEGYGEDAYLSSCMALAFIKGLQGDDMKTSVATCTKHFLGYGGGMDNTEKEIVEEILMPHEVAMHIGGNKSIMTNYGKYKGEWSVASKPLIQGVLRDYLKFDGIAVSDYGATAGRWPSDWCDTAYLERKAITALNAGNDIELCDKDCYRFIPQLIEKGKISEAQFEKAVKRNLTMKARLGLLDKDVKFGIDGEINLDKPEYRQTAYQLAVQSVVMLKNNGILPLNSSKTPNIALVGPNANTFWSMLGDYTYQSMRAFWRGGKVDPTNPKVYSLKEGLDSKIGDKFKLTYERGCEWASKDGKGQLDIQTKGDPRVKKLIMMLIDSADPTDWNNAIQTGGENDVIIAAVGENPTLCGEGRTRDGIRLPGDQEKFVEELIDTKKPVVVIVFGGRAQVLSKKIMDNAAAIMHAWYPGEEGGNAVADLLLGNQNPSGKLCTSYPATEQKGNLCYNTAKGREELIAYPFGHGLSYSTFEYSNLTPANATVKIGKNDVVLSCSITNKGKMDGAEIVQLYISPKGESSTHKPIQLKGFKRVELKTGQSKQVKFRFSPEILAYYDGSQWRMDPGSFEVKIGSSSSDIKLSMPLEITGKPDTPKENREIFLSHCEIVD